VVTLLAIQSNYTTRRVEAFRGNSGEASEEKLANKDGRFLTDSQPRVSDQSRQRQQV